MSITRRKASGASRVAGTAVPIPALLTSTSTRPNCATVCSTTRLQSSTLATSAAVARQRRPRSSTLALVSCKRPSRRAQIETSAPACASPSANATPSPDEAPVTIATLPSRRKRSRTLMGPKYLHFPSSPQGPAEPAQRVAALGGQRNTVGGFRQCDGGPG